MCLSIHNVFILYHKLCVFKYNKEHFLMDLDAIVQKTEIYPWTYLSTLFPRALCSPYKAVKMALAIGMHWKVLIEARAHKPVLFAHSTDLFKG